MVLLNALKAKTRKVARDADKKNSSVRPPNPAYLKHGNATGCRTVPTILTKIVPTADLLFLLRVGFQVFTFSFNIGTSWLKQTCWNCSDWSKIYFDLIYFVAEVGLWVIAKISRVLQMLQFRFRSELVPRRIRLRINWQANHDSWQNLWYHRYLIASHYRLHVPELSKSWIAPYCTRNCRGLHQTPLVHWSICDSAADYCFSVFHFRRGVSRNEVQRHWILHRVEEGVRQRDGLSWWDGRGWTMW